MTKNFQGLNANLIHQLKRKIGELNEEKEKLQTIFDNANDGILIADTKDKKFYTGNKTICRMLGYSLGKLKNLGILDIHSKKDLPYVMSQFKLQSMKKIGVAKDIPVKRKDGSIFYADINSSPIIINERPCLLGIFRDVTEKKKAEEALKENEEKYRILIENTTDMIYMIDKNNKVLSLNKSAARLFGKKSKEIAGSSLFKLFPKQIAAHFVKGIQTTFKTGKNQISETKMIAKGKERWISANLSPITSEGKIVAVMGITRDLTERRKIEEKLRQTITELKRKRNVKNVR